MCCSSATSGPATSPRPLRVVHLVGRGLSLISADASLAAGRDYDVTQAWSRALYEHPDRPDGIRFRGRHDPSQVSLAIFGRCRGALRARDRGSLLGMAAVEVLSSLVRYGFTVTP